jgi:hypothetical protein
MPTDGGDGDVRQRSSNARLFSYALLALPVIILFFLCGGCSRIDCFNPARRPSKEIEAEILAATPPGTDISSVQEYIRTRWGKRGTEFHEPRSPDKRKKGISTAYGRPYYQFPNDVLDLIAPHEVRVCWFFDEHDQLDEVRVDRYQNGP